MYNEQFENRNIQNEVLVQIENDLNTVELKAAWKAVLGSTKRHCSEQVPCDGCRSEIVFEQVYGG